MKLPKSKVFGIGLSRTGTLTLTVALRALGYSAVHCPKSIDDIVSHDAASDTPIAVSYKTLDIFFPGSKFILTDRKLEAWLTSCEAFFSTHPRSCDSFFYKIRQELYGRADFDAVDFCRARERHIADVLQYFSSRPRDLLVLRICEGEGWDKLCAFLEKRHPNVDFPHKNKTPLMKSAI